ncbi:MAG TPA: hypothetical protein VN081_03200 [Dongiaceae bacterium]|nr:hypothetical protein [Dongiaceae bacterium]
MINAISKALYEIQRGIPQALLVAAFRRNKYADSMYGGNILDFGQLQTPGMQSAFPVTLDARMKEAVIEKRVRVDCNLVGGTQVSIPLNRLQPEYLSGPWNVIYRVPKELTQNRSISSVLSLTIGQGSVMGTTNMGMQGASPMLDAVSSVLSSALPIPLVSTAYVQLIGENTILIQDNMALPNNIWLRCYLESDDEFSQLIPQQIHQFCELCTLATKSYVYNELVVETDMARLVGGMELGRFREILDGYADSEQNYKDYREKWAKIVQMTDPMSRERMLRMMVGGAH